MSEIVICSNPECQTTAGCLCGQGTKIYSGPGMAVVSEIMRIDPRDAEITSLRAQLEEARADDYIDKLNVLCEDFGCEGGSDRFAWLHDELSKISRLQSRIEELERALKPFADAWERFDASMDIMDNDWLKAEVADGLTWGDLRQARSALEASHKGGK